MFLIFGNLKFLFNKLNRIHLYGNLKGKLKLFKISNSYFCIYHFYKMTGRQWRLAGGEGPSEVLMSTSREGSDQPGDVTVC